MTNTQDANFNMFMATEGLCNKNTPVTATIVNAPQLIAQFSANNASIQTARINQELDRSGISKNKKFLRNDLITKAFDIARNTNVYAIITNNFVLSKEIDFSITDLKRLSISKLRDKTQLIYDRAFANTAALAPYGISAAMIAALKTAIDAYRAALSSVRTATVDGKMATYQLNTLFAANFAILEKLDLLMEVVRLTQPTFYKTYFETREVIDPGKRYLTLKMQISDAVTALPVSNAKVKFYLQSEYLETSGKGISPVLEKKTKEKGGFNVDKLADGIYTVVISKTGYKTKQITVNIAEGDYQFIKETLEPND